MTSNDNNIYVREDVFHARMDKLEAVIERNLAITRADIADFKAEINSKIADVRTELKTEIANVHSELKTEIADLRSDVRVQSSRIDNLVHWNSWIIAIFVAFFMMPSVIEGVRAVFAALSKGITSFFKRKNSD